MLKVTINGSNISASLVERGEGPAKLVTGLRDKLRFQVIVCLSHLHFSEVGELQFEKDGNIYRLFSKEGALLSNDILTIEALETIGLLDWFLDEPHFFFPKAGGILGSAPICRDCGYSNMTHSAGDGCFSPVCPSHAKWQKIDDWYVRPRDPFKRAFMCLPRADTSNGLPTEAEARARVKDTALDM